MTTLLVSIAIALVVAIPASAQRRVAVSARITTAPVLVPQVGHAGQIWAMAWSPDGRFLATGGFDHTVRIWDDAGRLWAVFLGHHEAITGLAWSPDGGALASSSRDGTIRVHDLRTSARDRILAPAGWGVAWSPDGRTVVSAGLDANVRAWDAASSRLIHEGAHPRARQLLRVAYSPDGSTVATSSHDGEVTLWDATSWQIRATSGPIGVTLWGLAYLPDGQSIVAAGNGQMNLFDTATARRTRTLADHSARVSSIAISPDGRTFATAGGRADAALWDVASGRVRARIRLERAPEALSFRATDGMLAMATVDSRRIQLWDPRGARLVRAFGDAAEESYAISASPDGRWLATTGHSSVQVWDTRTGTIPLAYSERVYSFGVVSWAPGSDLLAIGGERDDATVVEVPSGRVLARFHRRNPQNDLYRFAWLPDGSALVVVNGPQATLWNRATGRRSRFGVGDDSLHDFVLGDAAARSIVTGSRYAVRTIALPRGRESRRIDSRAGGGFQFAAVAMRPDVNRLATTTAGFGAPRQVVALWDLASGTELARTGGFDVHSPLVFRPDGAWLAYAGPEHTLRVWDGRSEPFDLARHTEPVRSIAWSTDGLSLASGGDDGRVAVVDVATRRILRQVEGHDQRVWTVGFMAGNRVVASASSAARLTRIGDGRELFLHAFRGADGRAHGLVFGTDGAIGGDLESLGYVLERSGPGIVDARLAPALPGRHRVNLLAQFLAE